MRYKRINKELFAGNRKKLAKELKPNSLVVVNANDIMPTNSDGTMRFRQNSDLFYLSGVIHYAGTRAPTPLRSHIQEHRA